MRVSNIPNRKGRILCHVVRLRYWNQESSKRESHARLIIFPPYKNRSVFVVFLFFKIMIELMVASRAYSGVAGSPPLFHHC